MHPVDSMPGRSLTIAVSLLVTLAFAPAGTGVARAQSSGQDSSELLIDEARADMSTGAYSHAARLLDRAIEQNPRRVDAYVLRATLYAIEGKHAEGIALMKRAQALAPDHPDVLNTLGGLLVRSGNPAMGVPLLERVLALEPNRYEALALLGRHYARTKEWAKAESYITAYLANRPKRLARVDSIHLNNLANAKLRLGDAPAALALFEQVLARDPDNTRAQLGQGWSLAAIDCNLAVPAFQELVGLGPRYPDLWLVWGTCALTLGNLEPAGNLARQYIAARPDRPDGYALRGRALRALGDLSEAHASFERAAELAPHKHSYQLALARLDLRMDRADAAVERLAPSVPAESDPLWEPWLLLHSEALLRIGDSSAAVRVARQVTSRNLRSRRAHALAGEGLLRIGKLDEAINHLEQAVAQAPGAQRPRRLLVRALNSAANKAMVSGELQQAENYLTRARTLTEAPSTLRNLGLVRILRGRATDALAPLSRIKNRTANDSHLYGRALAMAGKLHEAEVELQRALAGTSDADRRAALVALDLAATQVELGTLERAVNTLAPFVGVDDRVQHAYGSALQALAAAALADRRYARAVTALDGGLKLLPASAVELRSSVTCDLALAATLAQQRVRAIAALRRIQRAGAHCPYPTPADRLFTDLMLALNRSGDSKRPARTLRRLAHLRQGSSGPIAIMIDQAIALLASTAAAAAYARGNIYEARRLLDEVQAATHLDSPELRHNRAVLALDAGRHDAAISALTAILHDVPEALVNIGIAYERKGDIDTATRFYRRAAAHPKLNYPQVMRWITTKEQLYGTSIGRSQ